MVTDNKNKGFAARLNEKLDAAGAPDWDSGRQKWVASFFKDKFKISEIGARKWMMGEGMPDTKKLDAIADKLHTNVNYLLSGNDDAKQATPQSGIPPRILKAARKMVDLTPEARDYILGIIELLPTAQNSKVWDMIFSYEPSKDPHHQKMMKIIENAQKKPVKETEK